MSCLCGTCTTQEILKIEFTAIPSTRRHDIIVLKYFSDAATGDHNRPSVKCFRGLPGSRDGAVKCYPVQVDEAAQRVLFDEGVAVTIAFEGKANAATESERESVLQRLGASLQVAEQQMSDAKSSNDFAALGAAYLECERLHQQVEQACEQAVELRRVTLRFTRTAWWPINKHVVLDDGVYVVQRTEAASYPVSQATPVESTQLAQSQ